MAIKTSLAALLLLAATTSHAQWVQQDKLWSPSVIVIMYLDNIREKCPGANWKGCTEVTKTSSTDGFAVAYIERGESPYVALCHSFHEVRHGLGWSHYPAKSRLTDCGTEGVAP